MPGYVSSFFSANLERKTRQPAAVLARVPLEAFFTGREDVGKLLEKICIDMRASLYGKPTSVAVRKVRGRGSVASVRLLSWVSIPWRASNRSREETAVSSLIVRFSFI